MLPKTGSDKHEENGLSAQPTLEGRVVVLRPAEPHDAAELARSIASDPEASPWWGGNVDRIKADLVDPTVTLYVIEVGGDAAGAIMYEEQNHPDYRYASVDISLLSPWIGHGYGSDALRTLAHYLFEVRGHHRLHIDPAASNERAIQAYERVGFKPVGVLRRYERGDDGVWHDGLLMDLLAEELVE